MSDKQVLIEKKAKVSNIKDKIDNANIVLFLDFRGLNVPIVTSLRSELKGANADAAVNKNTLTRIALGDLDRDYPKELLVGPSMMVTSEDNAVGVSKIVAKFAKENESLGIKGGFLKEKVIADKDVVELSKLPSREELLAKLVGQLNAPIYGFVNNLSGQIRNLVYTLKAIEDKKNGGEQ